MSYLFKKMLLTNENPKQAYRNPAALMRTPCAFVVSIPNFEMDVRKIKRRASGLNDEGA